MGNEPSSMGRQMLESRYHRSAATQRVARRLATTRKAEAAQQAADKNEAADAELPPVAEWPPPNTNSTTLHRPPERPAELLAAAPAFTAELDAEQAAIQARVLRMLGQYSVDTEAVRNFVQEAEAARANGRPWRCSSTPSCPPVPFTCPAADPFPRSCKDCWTEVARWQRRHVNVDSGDPVGCGVGWQRTACKTLGNNSSCSRVWPTGSAK